MAGAAAFVSAPCLRVDEVLGHREFPRMPKRGKPSCVGRDSLEKKGRRQGSFAPKGLAPGSSGRKS